MKNTAKFRLLRPLALCLCLALALSACSFNFPFNFFGDGGAAGADAEPPPERRTISYDEMEYERPDVDAMTARIAELTAALPDAADFDAVLALDEEAGMIYERFDSMNSLAMLKKYHDVNDTYWEDEYRYMEGASVEMELADTDFRRALIEGPWAGDYRDEVGDYYYTAVENQTLLYTDEVADYRKERNDLAVDYNNLLAGLTYTYEGTEYTLDDVYAADSQALYYALMEGLYNENAEEFTGIYARMVQLDKDTADTLGFESPADMYYISYNRDYGPAEGQKLLENVKDIYSALAYALLFMSYDAGGAVEADTLAAMPEALAAVDPELAEAWEFMLEYGLTDLDKAAGKQSGVAFSTEIAEYDAPFLFMNWDEEDFRSASTLVHEFGHCYDFWLHYTDSIAFDLDLAEVYSQGLELLMHNQYSYFTDNVKAAQLGNLVDMVVSAVVYQAALEEFQLRVYALDSFDSAILGQLWNEVLTDYGLGLTSETDENGADNTWFRVTHLFDAPFYTASYVTSALAALQIWSEGQDDWDAAADTYMDLIHADQNQPFTQLMESVGLRSVHSPAVMASIEEDLVAVFDLASQDLPFAA